MVFTSHAVTHPNILPSQRSSKLHSSPSQQLRMLPYHSVVSKRSGGHLRDLHLGSAPQSHSRPAEAGNSVHHFCRSQRQTPFRNHRIHNFGTMLSPYTFSAHIALYPKIHRVVSYYALFKGWLLLSQPPTCLRQRTSFSLSIDFGTLICDLGCFPCVHEA